MMMTIQKDAAYDEFQKNVLERLEQTLPLGVEIFTKTIQKGSVELDGIEIVDSSTSISLLSYFEELYADYTVGAAGMDALCYQMQGAFINKVNLYSNIEEIRNYELMQEKLQVRLLSKENTRNLLRAAPHKEHEMGVIVPYIVLKQDEKEHVSVQVTNELCTQWGMSGDELIERALENTQEQDKVEFQSLWQIINELSSEMSNDVEDFNEERKMFVLTNEARLYGATAILQQDVLEKIHDDLQTDFYVLPSSIHEVIVLPKGEESISENALREMVMDINKSMLEEGEFLSNNIFEYNGREKELKKCMIEKLQVSHDYAVGRTL
jgi:hypothetical protein